MDPSPQAPTFIVLTVYTSSPEHRQQFVDLIHDFASAQALSHPGLCSFEIFTEEGEQHIVTLARWKDRASFEAFKASGSSIRAAAIARVLSPVAYFLRPEAALEEPEAPVRRAG